MHGKEQVMRMLMNLRIYRVRPLLEGSDDVPFIPFQIRKVISLNAKLKLGI